LSSQEKVIDKLCRQQVKDIATLFRTYYITVEAWRCQFKIFKAY
jgi:hypothetical protein